MNYKLLGIKSLLSAIIGIAMSMLIIGSENGYVGGMIFVPIFLLVIVVSLILFSIGIIGISQKQIDFGVTLLISSLLLPTTFVVSCLIAKYLEIGAYHQEPMIQF